VTDKDLQQAVHDELEWDPSVDAAHIGITANNGVVTLTGHVGSYAQKWAVERAAGRVFGVKAVAEELDVRCPSDTKNADDEIAKRAVQILSWDIRVPADKVKVKVEKGRVTLSGELHWYYQRNAAESDIRKLHGVTAVVNNITIKPTVQASDVREKITSALRRNAQVEASKISVTADGGRVTLSGNVDSWYERNLAERTAWSAPGVTQVEDRLTVA
jgi:osmotically-inducible protein OsmY